MPRYFHGTGYDDTVIGNEPGLYSDFGVGYDKITAGSFNDTFILSVDEKTDTIDGGKGEDLVDYSNSDRGLTIDLGAGKVTALFGGGLTEVLHYATVANLANIEDAIGSRFADTLKAKTDGSVLEGGGGADNIYGGVASYAHSAAAVRIDLNQATQHGGDAEGDRLYSVHSVIGSSQDDRIVGLWAGNNTIEGGAGADYISGGSITITTATDASTGAVVHGWHIDENTASYVHSSAGVQIDLHQVVQHFGDADGDQLVAIDRVLGSAFDDHITGNSANNFLSGGAGDDTFSFSGGYDWIEGGSGLDTYVVGQLPGTGGVNVTIDVPTDLLQVVLSPVDGTPVDFVPLPGTVVYYSGGRDFMTSIESFVGSQNSDTFDASHVSPSTGIAIDGAGGVDYITGSDGSDHLHGGSEGDILWGQKGDDYLYGGSGDDTLYGDDGNDLLFGDDNDDWLVGGAGADVINGGSGTNTADYSASSAGVSIQLERMTGGFYSHYTNFGTGSGGDAEGDSLVSIQRVIGSNSDDKLVGDYHDNILSGGGGNDTLIGGGGNDTLYGGPGDDILTGGGGLVAGASDSDTFVFQFYTEAGPANIGNDTITDFQHGIDILQFENLSSSQVAHVVQDHDNAVITFDHVLGSITLLNTHAADVGWIV